MGQIRRHILSRGHRRAFTLIELIVTVTVLAITAVAVGGVMVAFMRIFLFLPREMKAKTVAHEIAETVIEGEPGSPGIRYSAAISGATSTTITFTSGYPTSSDQVTVTYTYDTINERVQRTVGAAAAQAIPYYSSGDITVTCPSDRFFSYYDSAQAEISNPNTQALRNTIKRIEMTYTVKTGTGNFGEAQSSFTTTSGTDVKQYV